MPFSITSSSRPGIEFSRPLFQLKDVEKLYFQTKTIRKAAKKIEKQAAQLAKDKFPCKASHKFMEDVVRWGGGNRILEQARNLNTPIVVASKLRCANKLISEGNLSGAVDAVAELKYIGHSFASKHIRMMCPDRAGTLDSRIRNRLGYSADAKGYEEFLKDLEELKRKLSRSDQVEISDKFRICDVEMIVYAALG